MCGGAIKSLFGGSDGPEMQKIDPVATMTTVEDTTDSTGDADAASKARRKRGFSSTQLRDWRNRNTTALSSTGTGKQYLG